MILGAITQPARPRIGSDPVQYHTKQDCRCYGRQQDPATGKVFIHNDDHKHDAGQTAWPKPAHEQLGLGVQFEAMQAKVNRQHSDHGQAENGVKDDFPVDEFPAQTDRCCPAHEPSQQRHQVANGLCRFQVFLFLTL